MAVHTLSNDDCNVLLFKTHQNWESLDNMSLLKGHCLHKGYVQMPAQKVNKWIYQPAVAHLGTQDTQYELSRYIKVLQWTPWCWKEHHRSSCYCRPSPSEVCWQWLIGASLSEPHTSESNSGFFIYYILYIIHRMSFRKYKLTLLTRNVAHAEFKCGRNIEKNTWSQHR